MTTKTRQLKNWAAGAIVGLASLLPGCKSGISEFNPMFRPNEITSTHKQRGLFDMGGKVEKMYESGQKWTLDPKTNTLWVRGENYTEVLNEFGIKENGTYNEFYEGSRIQINFDDPRTGQEVTETQIVANDGTIDSKYFGTFDAFATRTKLDEAITKKAREKFNDEGLEVAVQAIPYPFADKADTFLGYGAVNSWNGSMEIISLLNQPLRAQFAAMAAPAADSKYVVLMKHATNAETVAKDDERFVDRVIVYGPTSNFVGGLYHDINFADKDYLVGLGWRVGDNVRANFAYAGGFFNDLTGVSDALRQAHDSLDQLGHAEDYLTNGQVPHESRMQQAIRRTGEVKTLLDNTSGVKAGLQTLTGAGQ